MSEVEYLDLEDLLGLVRRMEIGPVRDLGLLDAAVARPQSSAFGEDAYPTLELKAAALLHSLCRNHPLADGNNRLAWAATVVFLDISGLTIALENDDAFELVMAVAVGDLEVEPIADRLST